MKHSRPRLGKGSTLLEARTYYLPGYLHERTDPDGRSWLIMRHVAAWVTKSGHRQARATTDVREYPDGEAMVADIEAHPEWREAPSEADGNPRWLPDDLALAAEVAT